MLIGGCGLRVCCAATGSYGVYCGSGWRPFHCRRPWRSAVSVPIPCEACPRAEANGDSPSSSSRKLVHTHSRRDWSWLLATGPRTDTAAGCREIRMTSLWHHGKTLSQYWTFKHTVYSFSCLLLTVVLVFFSPFFLHYIIMRSSMLVYTWSWRPLPERGSKGLDPSPPHTEPSWRWRGYRGMFRGRRWKISSHSCSTAVPWSKDIIIC